MLVRPNHLLDGFVKRLTRHSALSVEEQHELLQIGGMTQTVAPHCELVHPGTRVDHSILVVDGVVGRFDAQADGGRATTAVFIPGDMCDLHSVAIPQVSWGIVSLSRTTYLPVPHEQLRAAAARYPAIALAFWADTVIDASIISKLAANLGRRDAQKRLAHFLCEMGIRYERTGNYLRTEYPLPVSQPNLADCLGMTSIHLNRSLKTLRDNGLIEHAAGIVRIFDWNALVRVAEFTPDYLL